MPSPLRASCLLAIAALLAPACGHNPSEPSSTSARAGLHGVWTGMIALDSCANCAGPQNPAVSFVMRLDMSGTEPSATIEVAECPYCIRYVVDARGRVNGDASVSLSGSSIRDNCCSTLDLRDWRVAADPANGLTGDVSYVVSYSGSAASKTGRITTAAKHEHGSDVFSGVWEGVYVRTACSGECRGQLEFRGDITFRLVQSGAQVSGDSSLAPNLTVAGQIESGTLRLSGIFERPPSSGSAYSWKLDQCALRATDLGRMSGACDYEFKFMEGTTSFTSRWHIELLHMTRRE